MESSDRAISFRKLERGEEKNLRAEELMCSHVLKFKVSTFFPHSVFVFRMNLGEQKKNDHFPT